MVAINEISATPTGLVPEPAALENASIVTPIRPELFRLSELRRFFTYCRDNFTVFPLRAIDNQPGLFLRHDVDLDLEPALQLARFESECGVSSTFFVQLTALTYNALTNENRERIKEIHRLGFEIGLHFDCALYPEDKAEVGMIREASMLADIVGEPIRSVSLHAPSLNGRYPIFPGMLNAYDPSIFGPGIYLSDSCMQFRGDPWIFVEEAKHRTIQLLLHPLHFTSDGDDYGKIFHSYHARMLRAVDTLWRINKGYGATVPTLAGTNP